jgi:hypothetical protein
MIRRPIIFFMTEPVKSKIIIWWQELLFNKSENGIQVMFKPTYNFLPFTQCPGSLNILQPVRLYIHIILIREMISTNNIIFMEAW